MRKMQEEKCAPAVVTYNSLINACAKALNAERAEYWLAQMCDSGLQPDSVSYSTVVHACVRAHEANRAAHWLDEMGKAGFAPSGVQKACVNRALASSSSRCGQLGRDTRKNGR